MKVGVVGTGYVGLVTGACLAEKGNDVVCHDIDLEKLRQLREGIIPIFEPGLEQIVKRNVDSGSLVFSDNLEDAVRTATFLALPTPESEDGSADLQHVLGAATKIGSIISEYTVVITKSTVPPGTAEAVSLAIGNEVNDKNNFDIVSNPEFLKEGDAVRDFQHPDRIVVGADSDRAWSVLRELYLPFVPNRSERLVRVGVTDAELIKYVANVALATRVAFTNEISGLCEIVGADIRRVMSAVGMDQRIGQSFLNPGPGYGGSCFPKDVAALIKTAQDRGARTLIGEAVHESNREQLGRLYKKVVGYFGKNLTGKKIAVWGLSFKPNTDDIRESPAMYLIDSLVESGCQVAAYDPAAMEKAKKRFTDQNNIKFGKNKYEVLDGADALVVVTDWDEFKTPNWPKVGKLLKAKRLFDGRSLYQPEELSFLGFYYNSNGRAVVGK
jgi:UDPglucose 6-dehydrogenase